LVGAIEVFLFGVVWTHGVYGSRMAWLAGVVLPLLAITGGLAWAATRYRANAGPEQAEVVNDVMDGGSPLVPRDRRHAPRAIGIVSLVLIGIPLAFAALLLLTYGVIFVGHWLR
jgi:hypothetical protein